MNTDLFRAIILATVMIALPTQATETPAAPDAPHAIAAPATSPAPAASSTKEPEHVLHINTDQEHRTVSIYNTDDGTGKQIKIVKVLHQQDGSATLDISNTDDQATTGDQDEDKTVIRFRSSGDGITAIKNVIDSLMDTEWDDLDDTEKQALIQSLENINDEMEVEIDLDSQGSGTGNETDTEGVVAIIAVFGLPLFIVIVVCYYRYRKERIKSETIKNYLNAGQEVPAEIIQVVPVEDSLQSGIRNLATGIGLFLFLGFVINWKIAMVASIPLFIGLGKLVVWYINRDRDNAAKQAD